MIFRKRQKEKEELNYRLDVARNNFSIAQENLQKVLNKKDLKSEHLIEQSSSMKVILGWFEKFYKNLMVKSVKLRKSKF